MKQRRFSKSLLNRKARQYCEKNPNLKEFLRFYRKVVSLQKDAQAKLPRRLPHLKGAQLTFRIDSGELLLKPEELEVDMEILKTLFQGIGHLFAARGGETGPLMEAFVASVSSERLKKLVDAFQFRDEEEFLAQVEEDALDPELVYSLLHLSLAPFYWRMVEPLAKRAPLGQVPRGNCPACGDLPVMALIREKDGVRILECSLCGARWGIPRIICPFCLSTDQNKLGYMYDERDKGHRVYHCDECRTYLKVTLSGGEREEEVVLPLEDMATLALDLEAEKRGYKRGCRTFFS